MSRKKMMWALLSVVLLAVMSYAIFWWWSPQTKAITEEEAKQIATATYKGEVIQTSKQDDQYTIELQADTGLYEVKIDTQGEIVSMRLKEKTEVEPPKQEQPKQQLSADEIKKILAAQGTVNSLEYIADEKAPHYRATVTKNNEEQTVKLDPFTGEITETTTKARLLSEADAIKIALEKQPGEVDDVDFIEETERSPYYLVEIEINEDRDAVVEIDAFTREIKSVTYDEDDSD